MTNKTDENGTITTKERRQDTSPIEILGVQRLFKLSERMYYTDVDPEQCCDHVYTHEPCSCDYACWAHA